jgi:hypothetical protein
MKARRIIDEFIDKNAKNKLERKALMKLAEIEEVGVPTPQRDLPNLKKDRLVLEIINRTNTSSTINLFGLPSGTNTSQGITYGDVFETIYSAVTIPIAIVGVSQTYTVNWTDADGVAQSGTTVAVANIDDLITELLLVTGDNFYYYTSGTNYVVHKQPINTWLYWTPPSTTVIGTALTDSLNQVGGSVPTTVKSIVSRVAAARTFVYSLFEGLITYWESSDPTQKGQIDFDTLYSFGGAGTTSFMIYMSNIDNIACINYDTKVFLRNEFDALGNPVNVVNTGFTQSSAGISWDSTNNLFWSSAGATGGANNDLYIYSIDGVLQDTWAAGTTLSLSANTASIGYSRIIINEAGVAMGYWVLKGNNGSNFRFKSFVKIGGYDTATNTIVESTSTTIDFLDAISDQLGLTLVGGDEPTFYTRISDTNKFFVVISNNAVANANYIGTVDLDTQEQNWKYYSSNDLTIVGDVYYSTATDSVIAKVNYLSPNPTVRAINYETLEINSLQLLNVSYDAGAFYYEDYLGRLYLADNAPLGYGAAALSGGSASAPANSQPASFYSQNNFSDLIANTSAVTYSFQNYTVIGGTGISVTEIIGNLTYAEIVQELRSGIEPYYFGEMSIYADSDEQANTPIKKVSRGVMGNSKTLFNNPTIVYENNSIVLNTPINFLPQTINQLDYKLLPFTKVRIIINYTKGNLNAIAETLNEYLVEGIPFSVGLNQLADSVTIKKAEAKYLENTLKEIWVRKKEELKLEGVQIEIDNLFESQAVINKKKEQLAGKKTQLVKSLLEQQKLEKMGLGGLSKNNIKRLVANYTAKGKADDINDPYNYFTE